MGDFALENLFVDHTNVLERASLGSFLGHQVPQHVPTSISFCPCPMFMVTHTESLYPTESVVPQVVPRWLCVGFVLPYRKCQNFVFLTNMALGTKNINFSGLKSISEARNLLNYPKSPKCPVAMSGKSF